jgi:hypothetical protein
MMRTGSLFTATAVVEGATGLALLIVPAEVARILLGASFEAPAGQVVARVAGSALLALALANWRARSDERSAAAAGVVAAMLLYNTVTAAVLAYAGYALRMRGIGLWPAVVLHAVMAVWCLALLRRHGR